MQILSRGNSSKHFKKNASVLSHLYDTSIDVLQVSMLTDYTFISDNN